MQKAIEIKGKRHFTAEYAPRTNGAPRTEKRRGQARTRKNAKGKKASCFLSIVIPKS
ncbi:MAG TPA: hypothetical protein QF625_00190 [Candidatus Scalindua sp.]|nr:hypothetical protein [Candidatus Scalindua sp.]